MAIPKASPIGWTPKDHLMKACWFDRFGPARDTLQFGDWPTPDPRPGEVLVRLQTTGVNPSDVKKRAGAFPDLLIDNSFNLNFRTNSNGWKDPKSLIHRDLSSVWIQGRW